MHDKLALENTKQAGPLNPGTKTSLKFLSLWALRCRAAENERDRRGEMSRMISDNAGREILLQKEVCTKNLEQSKTTGGLIFSFYFILFTNLSFASMPLNRITVDSSKGNLLLCFFLLSCLSMITAGRGYLSPWVLIPIYTVSGKNCIIFTLILYKMQRHIHMTVDRQVRILNSI